MSGKRTRALRVELREHLIGAGQSDDRRYRKIVREKRQRVVGTPRPRRAHSGRVRVEEREGEPLLITNLKPKAVSYDGKLNRLSRRRFWG